MGRSEQYDIQYIHCANDFATQTKYHIDWARERYTDFENYTNTTVCPRSSDPFYVVNYYIKWVTTIWTDGTVAEGWLDTTK